MYRRTENAGAFAHLPVSMQLREVRRIAKKFDIDLSEFTVKIQRDEGWIGSGHYGRADGKQIGRIDLFPDAFADEDNVVLTLVHEIVHVRQYQEHGVVEVMNNREKYEDEAIAIERAYADAHGLRGRF